MKEKMIINKNSCERGLKYRQKKKLEKTINLPSYKLIEWYKNNVDYTTIEVTDKLQINGITGPYVYIFYNGNTKLYKIGKTLEISKRRRDISNMSGVKIEIVIGLELEQGIDESHHHVEKLLHTFFQKKRVIGEWFILDLKDLISIDNLFWEVIVGWDILYSNNLLPDREAFRCHLKKNFKK